MRSRRLEIFALLIAVGLLSLRVPLAEAQDTQTDITAKPKPAGRSYSPNVDEDQNGDPDVMYLLQPDAGPLTGVQTPTLGSLKVDHSYLLTGFQYSNVGRSTALNQATAAGWNSTNYLAASVSLLQLWENAQLSLNYMGGAYLSSDKDQGNGYFHQFALSQSFQWQRWRLTLLDQSFYLPETAFGFGVGIGGLSVDTTLFPSQPGIKNNYLPNQSVLTLTGPRFSNTAAAQTSYAISPRSFLNFAGSYGVLRFMQARSIDDDEGNLHVGYEYQLSKRNTVGALYLFTDYRYPNNPQKLNAHAVQLAFGRKITGRLALQLSVGPQVATFHMPLESPVHHVGGSGGATLDYASESSNVSLAYSHGITNGSGIQFGSNNDQVATQFERKLLRRWRARTYFEFARNTGLGSPAVGQGSQALNSYYAGGDLVRAVARNANLSLGYSAVIQTSKQPVCAAGVCATSFTQHQITLQLSWHSRPYVLQ